MAGVSLKLILIIVGLILAVVGIITDNWKLAAIGDTVAIIGLVVS